MSVLVAVATPRPTRTKEKTPVDLAESSEFNSKPLKFLTKIGILLLQQ